MKALEVSIDGKVIGVFVPPDDKPFSAMIANVPKTYMRAQILASNDLEHWQWQLPDVQEGQVISFRMIEAERDHGVPPHRVSNRDPEEVGENKKLAKEGYEWAMRERETQS
jgi:hypothetical protein